VQRPCGHPPDRVPGPLAAPHDATAQPAADPPELGGDAGRRSGFRRRRSRERRSRRRPDLGAPCGDVRPGHSPIVTVVARGAANSLMAGRPCSRPPAR
jgi:hypothetical protein